MKAIYIFLAALGLVLAGLGGSYISAHNYGVTAEAQLKAQYSDMENILAQYSLKVTETAQVPSMYKDDVKEIFSGVMTGRYGKDGSHAMFQFLKEHNPNIDAGLYRQIQQVIEGGRNQFQNSQTRFLDMKRSYETSLGLFWRGMWMRVAGFPKVDLEKYKLITTESATETFQTGVAKPMKLR